jgi:hypothetical protein
MFPVTMKMAAIAAIIDVMMIFMQRQQAKSPSGSLYDWLGLA